MRNLLTFKHCSLSPTSSWCAFLLALSLTTVWNRVQAAPPQTAPSSLKNLLTQVDAAANQHDVKAVMQFYGANFTHADGLTRQNMENALTQLWQRYPQLKYQTQLQSWRNDGQGIVAETITNITGTQRQDTRNLTLNATIKSQQRYENGKIVQQEILSERSQLNAGAKPPTVNLNLPQQVRVGQQYSFDAIVQEPLGDDYLVGAAIEEPIQADKYFNPTPVELELLPAGGLFKVGRAPNVAANRWVSAVLVRGEGLTIVTQRLPVVGAVNRSTIQAPGTIRK